MSCYLLHHGGFMLVLAWCIFPDTGGSVQSLIYAIEVFCHWVASQSTSLVFFTVSEGCPIAPLAFPSLTERRIRASRQFPLSVWTWGNSGWERKKQGGSSSPKGGQTSMWTHAMLSSLAWWKIPQLDKRLCAQSLLESCGGTCPLLMHFSAGLWN